MDNIVKIGLVLVVAAILIPVGAGIVAGATTTGWDPNVVLLYGLLPLFAILAIAYTMLVHVTKGGRE